AVGGLPSFGQEHFGACVLQDKRLTDRAVITADAFMRHPGGTLPQKLALAHQQKSVASLRSSRSAARL
ncbi:MAG TPA: transposase DNA-binding-containing protein, partial [Tepidisphaeraceae bacterium]|nr:transposase DNA-binding-containing protein [Tepidisphaeraceae bacterium]